MRDYLSAANLKEAALYGGIVGAMALPSVAQAGRATPAFCGATVTGMVLVAGFATAWQRHAGLVGLFPGWSSLRWGAPIAICFAILLLPIYQLIAPAAEAALLASPFRNRMELFFPTNTGTRLAYLLWSAGFEILFFHAATLGFFARLTKRREVAIAASVVLRGLVGYLQFGTILPYELFQLTLGLQMLRAVMTSLLLAHFGLLAATLLAVLLDLRHFF